MVPSGAKVVALHRMAKTDFARRRYPQSLDAGVGAEMQLLAQAGIAYARAHPDTEDWGATFDTIEGGRARLKVETSLFPKDGWLRICFDPGVKPGFYAAEVSHAHALGLRVVGQITDSSEMRRISVSAFERRTRDVVDALPDVDEWETGNEVNGNFGWGRLRASLQRRALLRSTSRSTPRRACWDPGSFRRAGPFIGRHSLPFKRLSVVGALGQRDMDRSIAASKVLDSSASTLERSRPSGPVSSVGPH